MEEKLISAVASSLNLDATELTAELKDGENWAKDAVEKLSAKVAAQVKAVKEAQYKRGIREKSVAVEKFLVKNGFANDDKLEGDSLLEAFVSHLKSDQTQPDPSGKEPSKLSREDLIKLPEVKALVEDAKKQAGEKLAALQANFDQEKQSWQKNRVRDIAAAKLPSILTDAKVILGESATRENRLKAISAMLNWGEIGVDDAGELCFIGDDGKPKTDDFGKPIDFKKYVTKLGEETFGIQKQNPVNGGGNPTGGPSGGSDGVYKPVYTFSNEKAFSDALLAATDPKDRMQIHNDWKHQQAAPQS